jgi:nucleoside-diphosphate-sugar epimerase
MKIALTGATGFLGGSVLTRLLVREHSVRALARRQQRDRLGVEWVSGDLSNSAALGSLVAHCDAVIHVAGAVNAPDRGAFAEANVEGTRRLVEAAARGGIRRFVLVSSLSARMPGLSDYGWSKRAGEIVVERSGLDWTIVRPPAIYGPGDVAMLELFKAARTGIVPLPPPGRLSVIEADDLADLLVRLVEGGAQATVGQVFEVDDGTPGGWTHAAFARALGRAVGRRHVLPVSLPRWALMTAARSRLIDGLTVDRARYFCHPDWVADPARAVPQDIWSPQVATEAGLAATAAAYRAKGWIR